MDKFYLCLQSLGVDNSVDDFQNRKCQVNLLSMLFHFIQANFDFRQKFNVFNHFKGSHVVYAGMISK